MRRLTCVALALLAIAFPVPLFPQFGSVTRSLGTVATVAVPRKARLDAPGGAVHEQSTWVSWRLNRFHTWAMGSNTPYRASLFITLHAASAPASSYDEALHAVERDLNGGADDWKQVVKDAQWDVIQGRYTVNMLNEPTWRLKYRDPSRRVSALWQVHQKDWTLDDARAALVKMVASIVRTAEPGYGEIADRPRKEAEENERKAKAALAWLAARGYGPLAAGKPVTKDGITVELRIEPERRIALYKSIADQPDAKVLPAWVSWGWRTHADSGWEDHMPNNDYYPSPGTRAYLDNTQAKPGPHYFLIRTIRLDVMDEVDFHIADWFDYAAKVK
jgi:hypothetical protein